MARGNLVCFLQQVRILGIIRAISTFLGGKNQIHIQKQ